MVVVPITAFPEIEWPAIPTSGAVGLLATLFQLEQSQNWSPEELAAQQFRQLARVVEHAFRTVPFYQRRFAEIGVAPELLASPEHWPSIPLLTRRDLQTHGAEMRSEQCPTAHGPAVSLRTSGSTNQPVVTCGTSLTEFFWRALTLRDHFWHRRDFSQSLATVRYTGDGQAMPPAGLQNSNWGPATEGVVATGSGHLLNVLSTVEQQADWLRRTNPGYVLGYPSALLAIARIADAEGWRLPNLCGLRTFGEILEPECRETCQRVFGVKVVDMYSSQEVGYIALQCPDCPHYHVQSENLLVEILDDNGNPCSPGQTGRVVVTTLHNFVMPLMRYDIGDYAELGPRCACGRGLPVLTRILGRQRNLLVMPDGTRRWPVFTAGERPEELPPFYQFQVVQRSRQQIEVLAVRDQPFTGDEEARVRTYMQQTLGYPFEVVLRRVDAIARSRTGKFEDFICEVP
jgi:phenylacetate-CoA ligase